MKKQQKNFFLFETEIWWILFLFFLPIMDAALKSIKCYNLLFSSFSSSIFFCVSRCCHLFKQLL